MYVVAYWENYGMLETGKTIATSSNWNHAHHDMLRHVLKIAAEDGDSLDMAPDGAFYVNHRHAGGIGCKGAYLKNGNHRWELLKVSDKCAEEMGF